MALLGKAEAGALQESGGQVHKRTLPTMGRCGVGEKLQVKAAAMRQGSVVRSLSVRALLKILPPLSQSAPTPRGTGGHSASGALLLAGKRVVADGTEERSLTVHTTPCIPIMKQSRGMQLLLLGPPAGEDVAAHNCSDFGEL